MTCRLRAPPQLPPTCHRPSAAACYAFVRAGGRDQFSWDNVKNDKEREYYLGHSVKVRPQDMAALQIVSCA